MKKLEQRGEIWEDKAVLEADRILGTEGHF